MSNRTRMLAVGATAAAVLALPTLASAHNATIACDQANPGHYLVTPDYLQLNPVTTFGPTAATVTWSDRYRVTLPYPAGCVAQPPPPPPAVQPPAPPVVPSAPVAAQPPPPPAVTPGAPEPMGRKRTAPRPRPPITCQYLLRHRAGKWSYIRRGFYYRCKAPVARKLTTIAVTG